MPSVRLPKESTPQRWHEALQRAHKDEIRVRQVHPSGQWVALSGDMEADAYVIDVIGAFAYACSCPAATHGDPVCKHRAAFYQYIGAMVEPEEGEEPTFCPDSTMYPPLPEVVRNSLAGTTYGVGTY